MGKKKAGGGGARGAGESRKGRPGISEGELLEGVKVFAEMRGGRAFTTKEFDSWAGRPFCSMTVKKRLGLWRDVLARVGVDGAARHEYSGEELLAEFERVWEKLGRRPGDHTLARHSKYTLDPYRRRWRTIRELGLLVTAMRQGLVSREAVLGADVRGGRPRRLRAGTRYEVLKRDGFRCVACGRSPANERGVELEVDHIVPVCKGGSNRMENLRTLCRACNAGKSGV